MLRAAVLGGAVGDLDKRQEISDGIFFRCFALLQVPAVVRLGAKQKFYC